MPARALRFFLVVAALLGVTADPLAAQWTPTKDWPAPPTPTWAHVRFGWDQMPAGDRGLPLRAARGFELAVGMGASAWRRFDVAWTRLSTRSTSYVGVSPGRVTSGNAVTVAYTPAVISHGPMAANLRVGAGVVQWAQIGGAGEGGGVHPTSLQGTVGVDLRWRVHELVDVTVGYAHMYTPVRASWFVGGASSPRSVPGLQRVFLGVALRAPGVHVPTFSIAQLPAADVAPVDPTTEPLVPSVPMLLQHSDGESQAGLVQAVSSYRGPQRLTLFFKDQSSTVNADDLPRLERVARLLADVPGTVIVLRGWDSPTRGRRETYQMAEARASAVRDVLVSLVPGVNPQRVSVVVMGPDESITDAARGRRVELQYYR